MTPARSHARDHRFGARRVGFERLFEQHVLAGGGEALDERQMRARRRQDQRRVDRRIVDERIEIAGEREMRIALAKCVASLRRRAVGAGDVDALGEVARGFARAA